MITDTELGALAVLINAETHAMWAENDLRKLQGLSPAYTEHIGETDAVCALRTELRQRGVLPNVADEKVADEDDIGAVWGKLDGS